MIGDNPFGDIRGANEKGWTSILVRSGVYDGVSKPAFEPTYTVDDMSAAYDLIKKENNL